jgi:hypothetical protein
MQAFSRRKFVASAGVLAVGITIGYHQRHCFGKSANSRGMIRLLPVEGVVYSESFTRFMERARFNSVRDAIASIRERSIPVRITHI